MNSAGYQRDKQRSRACPRCAGPALLSVEVSPGSEAVLCSACDLDSPTGGPVVLWFAVNGSLETPSDVEEVASLLRPWLDSDDVREAGLPSGSGGLICDFCEAAVPRWAYRAGAADWFACDSCRPYVDNREWSALAGAVGARSDAWASFADTQQPGARPWPPRSRVYRWP